jgi:glycosyltransferase involved in cell wall biosynthesis
MDNRDVAVSVITIVKNNEKLLPRAIASVLAQTFADFEYIIVNDGSIDGTEGSHKHLRRNR